MRTVGVAVLLAIGLAAPAQADRPKLQREYLAKYAELVDRHGVDEAGCNLLTDTAKWNRCEGKSTRAELRESTATLERMLYVPPPPQPKASPPVGVQAESVPEVGSAGGGATATTSGGSCGSGYRGLFQFDCQTWQSVGGSGDPAAASPAEQYARAQALQQQRGNQPWPVCGQGGASLEAIAQCESGGDPNAVG
jgi:hypothetical protein